MGPELKRDGPTKPGGGHLLTPVSILCLLSISGLIHPVTGYALKTCRISYDIAICVKMGLSAAPRDIPPTVRGLDLSANKLSEVHMSDFRNLPLLTQLDLNRNKIKLIEKGAFTILTSLTKLNLNNNKLVELGEDLFGGLSNVTELRINSNKIKTVASTSFRSMKSLHFLDISHNNLQDIAKVHLILQNLPQLRVLYIKNNYLTTFHSWELTNTSLKLKSLDLSQNPIADFRITANVFPNLTSFNIGGPLKKKPMIWDVRNGTVFHQVSTLDISGLHMNFDDMKSLFRTVNGSLTSLRMNAMKDDLRALINISCAVPTMSTLQLRRNKLRYVPSQLIAACFHVTELDLAENKIKRVTDDAFKSLQNLRILNLSRNKLSSVPAAIRNQSLIELDLSSNNISKLGCEDFVNQTRLQRLYLSNNSISALEECVFKDLVQLQVLKLQHNHMTHLNGAFRNYLSNLRQLFLNENELTSLKSGEFRGLQSLQKLSLHENKLDTLENGCFIGLTNLTDLLLQTNKIQEKEINRGCFNDMKNLRRLNLRENRLRYANSSALPRAPFSQLSRLEMLAIPSQHRKGKSHLPRNFLQGLTNLLVFSARDIQLLSLDKAMFIDTPQLQELDISSNDLVDLSPDLFFPIQNLKILYISRTSLGSLFYLTEAKLTKLVFLQARKNQYSVISEEIIKSLPALVYVDFQGNSFTCDCDNAWFIDWAKNNNKTQVFDAYSFKCNYPVDLKNTHLFDLDVQQCSVDTAFILFISTTSTILLFMVVSFTYHFLRDHLVYTYYLLLSLLFDKKHRNRQVPNQYDAFISYNTHDEPWVIRELLPKLEGEQGWRLCLHHRDFEPGKPIIENITDAIYGSRKTICVISRRYLKSEWCSKEIQLASFRLFHERKDVLILVFLEEIPTSQLSPYYNTRKLLKRQTYLSWPRATEHPQLFWEKLGKALKNKEDNDFHLSVAERE